jgi:hypothetical protein
VATRVFADEELARLREFPEISREECDQGSRKIEKGVSDWTLVSAQPRS